MYCLTIILSLAWYLLPFRKTKFTQMKRVLNFAAIAIFFASCGSNQQTTDNTSQTRIDSMSQAMTRQHIIDSMSAAATVNTAPAAAASMPARHIHESYSNEHGHSYNGNVPANSGSTSDAVPVSPAAPAVTNTVAGPSAADLAAQKKADHEKELKSAAEGALIGAGAGAIGGAVAGKNKKFKEQDAAIGGGLGAAVGAGAGLLLEKRKLKKDTTQH
jgi:hypothetical protein